MKTKNFFTVFAYLAALFAALFGVTFLISFIKVGQNDFYVQYGNAELSGTVALSLPADTGHVFRCKYIVPDMSGYEVKVIPNREAANFDFKLNGRWAAYLAEKDLTAAFNLSVRDDYFILYLDKDISMSRVLSAVYPGAVAEVPAVDIAAEPYFTLAVTSANKSVTVYINFRITEAANA